MFDPIVNDIGTSESDSNRLKHYLTRSISDGQAISVHRQDLWSGQDFSDALGSRCDVVSSADLVAPGNDSQ